MAEIGEAREKWGWDVWKQAEDFANNMKHVDRPFFIVYACKPDRTKKSLFRQSFKAYFQKPPLILGILVWEVNNKKGLFLFRGDLSAPYDIPVDPSLLSDKTSDVLEGVAAKGEKLKVINS